VNGSTEDAVIFCGSGATGAIDKLIRVLELGRRDRPVVFIGPYEHHSNELPWRESVRPSSPTWAGGSCRATPSILPKGCDGTARHEPKS